MGAKCSHTPKTIESRAINRVSSTNKQIADYSKTTNYRLKFHFISILGNGSYGQVRLYRDRETKLQYAIKTLQKAGITKHAYDRLIEEVSILRHVDHPNIVKYYETFEDDNYLHIVMEYLSGEDLYKLIARKHNNDNLFEESDMAKILLQLLKALLFLHRDNIVHRDIKPENILFGIKDDITSLKLIDFGLATTTMKKDSSSVGSPYYMAPEIILGEYTTQTDLWSVGVIMHVMLTGKFPFGSSTDSQKDIFQMIVHKEFDPIHLHNSDCTEEAKSLVMQLLIKDKKKRITTKDAIEHKWFTKFSRERNSIKLNDATVNSLIQFSEKTALQKEILFFIAKITNEDQIKQLRELFNRFDTNNTGTLTIEEMRNVFQQIGINVSEEDFITIWKGLVFHKETEVNYTEFLAATLSSLNMSKEENIWSAFKYFEDKDQDDRNSGYISFDSLLAATKAFNIKINENDIKKSFEELQNKGKKLDFKEFKALLMICE